MLNKVELIGHLGQEPNVRMVNDAKVATFTLATSERYKDKQTGKVNEATEWHNIVCWRALADITEKYCKKGDMVYIEGKLKTRTWTTKEGEKRYSTDIVAREVLLFPKKDKSSAPAKPAPSPAPAQSTAYLQKEDLQDNDEDLPF